MDLKQYVQDAIVTESRISNEQLKTNTELLTKTLHMFIAAANMLDIIKKQIFYRRHITSAQYHHHIDVLRNTAHTMLQTLPETYCVAPEQCVFTALDEVNHSRLDVNPRIFHSLLGTITESGELAETLVRILDGKEVDIVNIAEEFFDIDWYKFIFCDATNIDPETILQTGLAKLRARFPDKFNCEDANVRNLVQERQILEQVKQQSKSS